MTPLQFKIMENLASSDFAGVADPSDATSADDIGGVWLWIDEIAADIGEPVPTVKGAIGALTRDGYLHIQDYDTDTVATFTDQGFEAWSAQR